MSAVLLTPSPCCTHKPTDHCDSCLAELVLPSLQVVQCSWGIFKTTVAAWVR